MGFLFFYLFKNVYSLNGNEVTFVLQMRFLDGVQYVRNNLLAVP